ncbi:hypothetical protein E2C01_077370 [Portunus trituberculatus]|uniref:Uncharacterized protein n=1 Tax=Portunus trituberculatus TaxID=210409 RepID=A0A5B7IBA3_PORTR|nr:hypothetical protein [Portunus trituberculatus]
MLERTILLSTIAATRPPPPPPPNTVALYRQIHQIILRTATVRVIDMGGGVSRPSPLPPASRVPASPITYAPASLHPPPVALCPVHGSAPFQLTAVHSSTPGVRRSLRESSEGTAAAHRRPRMQEGIGI